MKAEHLDRQTLQLNDLQLQNDFALLRYLLFSPLETISNKAITVKISATSPLFNPKANPNPTSSAFPHSGPSEHKLLRSTPVGAVGPPRTKTNNTANADFQPTPNTQEAPSTTVQNLTSRICRLEKLFADEISAYTSITAGIHSQYFFYMINFASLNLAIQMLPFGRSPQWSLYLTTQKWPDHHQIPSSSWPQVLAALFSRIIPMDTTSSSNYTLMVLDPLRASVLQFYSPSSQETMTIFSNGPSQRPSTLVFEINWTQWTPGWKQFDRTKTQPTRSPQCQQKLESRQF